MSPQTTSKSRKVTVKQIFDILDDLARAKLKVKDSADELIEVERAYFNIIKRASAETVKKAMLIYKGRSHG
jgi:hypothetical protein